MPMKNPPHPGRSVRKNCLDPLGLSGYGGSGGSGGCPSYPFAGIERSRVDFARHGHPPREGRMSSADFWLNRQTAYDLAQARKSEGQNTGRAVPVPAHFVRNPE